MKKQQGFTLIELMIVVAVIGVLSAIAVPQYQNYVKKSELGAALASVTALKVNVEDYMATEGTFPDVATDALMKTTLGASTTSLGAIKTVPGTNGAGQIQIALTGTQNSSSHLALSRDADGEWTCLTDIADTEKAIFPKGCASGTML